MWKSSRIFVYFALITGPMIFYIDKACGHKSSKDNRDSFRDLELDLQNKVMNGEANFLNWTENKDVDDEDTFKFGLPFKHRQPIFIYPEEEDYGEDVVSSTEKPTKTTKYTTTKKSSTTKTKKPTKKMHTASEKPIKCVCYFKPHYKSPSESEESSDESYSTTKPMKSRKPYFTTRKRRASKRTRSTTEKVGIETSFPWFTSPRSNEYTTESETCIRCSSQSNHTVDLEMTTETSLPWFTARNSENVMDDATPDPQTINETVSILNNGTLLS